MNLDMQVVLGEKLRAMQSRSPEMVHRAIAKGLAAAGAAVKTRALHLVYAGHPEHLEGDSGRLRQSIISEVDGRLARVGSNVIYARIHELGGTIVAKTARALRFQVDGEWVVARRVTIPARPYLRPALAESRSEITRVFGNALVQELAL